MASKRPLIWLALLCIAPFVASFALYFWIKPVAQVNYGTLLTPSTLPAIQLQGAYGQPLAPNALRGKWILLTLDSAACAEACARKLYATRQTRTMQGKERERVARLWLVTGEAEPAAAVQAAHPDLLIAKSDPAWLATLAATGTDDGIYLVDPLGNLILRYPADPDIKRLNRDLARLLFASHIG